MTKVETNIWIGTETEKIESSLITSHLLPSTSPLVVVTQETIERKGIEEAVIITGLQEMKSTLQDPEIRITTQVGTLETEIREEVLRMGALPDSKRIETETTREETTETPPPTPKGRTSTKAIRIMATSQEVMMQVIPAPTRGEAQAPLLLTARMTTDLVPVITTPDLPNMILEPVTIGG